MLHAILACNCNGSYARRQQGLVNGEVCHQKLPGAVPVPYPTLHITNKQDVVVMSNPLQSQNPTHLLLFCCITLHELQHLLRPQVTTVNRTVHAVECRANNMQEYMQAHN